MEAIVPVQKRGLGSFPEFVGRKLDSIEHIYVPGDDYPERYVFHFGKLQHIHAKKKGGILDVGNYRFVGLVVSSASQYWDEETKKHVFEFIFEGSHYLSFAY
jgi:hypothetical protein